MRALVVDGVDYIVSHMVKILLAVGHSVVTLDNLVSDHHDAVRGGANSFAATWPMWVCTKPRFAITGSTA